MIQTKIMGIVNVTPDSFYSKSRAFDVDQAVEKAHLLQKLGADIIDIGGESTAPTSAPVDEEVEMRRVLPVLEKLQSTIPISIDTSKPQVAKRAIELGASIINDVTGFTNPQMRKLAADTGVQCCVMHMQGTPQTMQINPSYPRGVVLEVYEWLEAQTRLCIQDGIQKEKIIIDPGIGFGKTMQDNFALIQHAKKFVQMGFQVLYGTSRKTFLRKFFQKEAEDVLAGTLAVDSFLALQGVHILRVHDVQEHVDAIQVLKNFT